jgi:hypothetical protein
VSFAASRFEGCFPELFGFVLLDPERLDAFCEGCARGANLLDRFSRGTDGDRVSEAGIAIPLTQLEAGDYTIVVRDSDRDAVAAPPKVRSAGWVLGTTTGRLILCGLGYLTQWDPDNPRHRRLAVPPGWYEAEILGHVLRPSNANEEWLLEILLRRVAEQPVFRARFEAGLDLFPG